MLQILMLIISCSCDKNPPLGFRVGQFASKLNSLMQKAKRATFSMPRSWMLDVLRNDSDETIEFSRPIPGLHHSKRIILKGVRDLAVRPDEISRRA
jgi:hypothetical protein